MGILNTKGSVSRKRALDRLRMAISAGRVRNNEDAVKLVFLCGGNKEDESVSERRLQVESFLKGAFSSKIEIFYVENFVKNYLASRRHFELLELENDLFKISDRVILILEGYGSACELGAFANERAHRDKLIVINDKKYVSAKSFISMGPIRSIALANPLENRILYYPMSSNGKEKVDAIADTFTALHALMSRAKAKNPATRVVKLTLTMGFSYKTAFTQAHLFLVHDIIYLCGPLKSAALFEIFEYVFGAGSFEQIHTAVSLLKACGMITEDAATLYYSDRGRPFLRYTKTSRNHIIAAFRTLSI